MIVQMKTDWQTVLHALDLTKRARMSMTTPSGEPTSPDKPEELLDGSYTGPVKVRGALLRLLLSLAPTYATMYIVWGAVPGILLALQVEHLDPAAKVANLAVVSTIGAIVSMLAQPVAGLLSDRTRSIFGRRAPWMVVGSVIGGVLLILLGFQTSLIGISILWAAVSIAYNFAQAPMTAIMPDRIPHLARGRFSALSGLGTLVGILGGQFFGASMSGAIPVAYAILAVLNVVMFSLFTVFNQDRSSRDLKPEPFLWRRFLLTFWVNPIRHRDFFWGFTGRFLLNLAYYLVTGGYLLYILSDYIGLGTVAATAMVPMVAVASAPGGVLATLLAGPLSDRFARRKIFIVVSGLVFAAAMMILVVIPTSIGVIITFAIGGLAFGVFQSVDSVLMSEVLPDARSFGKDLGVVNMAITLPQSVAPAVAGTIVLAVGYVWLFPTAMLLCVLGSLAVIPIRSVR